MNISAPLAITRIESLEARVDDLEKLIMKVALLEANVQDIKWGIKHNHEANARRQSVPKHRAETRKINAGLKS